MSWTREILTQLFASPPLPDQLLINTRHSKTTAWTAWPRDRTLTPSLFKHLMLKFYLRVWTERTTDFFKVATIDNT